MRAGVRRLLIAFVLAGFTVGVMVLPAYSQGTIEYADGVSQSVCPVSGCSSWSNPSAAIGPPNSSYAECTVASSSSLVGCALEFTWSSGWSGSAGLTFNVCLDAEDYVYVLYWDGDSWEPATNTGGTTVGCETHSTSSYAGSRWLVYVHNDSTPSYQPRLRVEWAYLEAVFVDATATPTPAGSPTSFATGAALPFGCVNPTVTPSVVPSMVLATSTATATGSPVPTFTPTSTSTPSAFPFAFSVSAPLNDGSVAGFGSGAAPWNGSPYVSWDSGVGNLGLGSLEVDLASDFMQDSPIRNVLMFNYSYVRGWVYVDGGSASSVSVTAYVWGRNQFGVLEWLNAEYYGGSYSSSYFFDDSDFGEWLPFVVNPGREGYWVGLEAAGFGDESGSVWFDDLVVGPNLGESGGLPLCFGGVSTPAPLSTLALSGGGPITVTVNISDDANNPCVGYYGFDVAIPGIAPLGVPGAFVCFVRYNVEEISIFGIDFAWMIVLVLAAFPIILVINMVRTGRN